MGGGGDACGSVSVYRELVYDWINLDVCSQTHTHTHTHTLAHTQRASVRRDKRRRDACRPRAGATRPNYHTVSKRRDLGPILVFIFAVCILLALPLSFRPITSLPFSSSPPLPAPSHPLSFFLLSLYAALDWKGKGRHKVRCGRGSS